MWFVCFDRPCVVSVILVTEGTRRVAPRIGLDALSEGAFLPVTLFNLHEGNLLVYLLFVSCVSSVPTYSPRSRKLLCTYLVSIFL